MTDFDEILFTRYSKEKHDRIATAFEKNEIKLPDDIPESFYDIYLYAHRFDSKASWFLCDNKDGTLPSIFKIGCINILDDIFISGQILSNYKLNSIGLVGDHELSAVYDSTINKVYYDLDCDYVNEVGWNPATEKEQQIFRDKLVSVDIKLVNGKLTKWTPEENEKYFYIDDAGLIWSDYNNSPTSASRIAMGNCFPTEDVAKQKHEWVAKLLQKHC